MCDRLVDLGVVRELTGRCAGENGLGASVGLLVEDLIADLEGRSFEIAKVKDG